MVQKLGLIAIIGLTASAACMGAAAAIGGSNFGGDIDDGFLGLFNGRPRCQALPNASAASRDFNWDGDHFTLAVPGQANYTPGTDDRLHASGDPQVLAHLRVRDGRFEMDCRGWRDRSRDLTITLPGREFRKFTIAGGGKLVLDKLNQANAEIVVAGAGKINANGRIDDLKTKIAGSGDADLDQITAREAEMEIAGSGNIKANGKFDSLDMDIAGSGHIDISQVEARKASVGIHGSGTVNAKGKIDDVKIEIAGSGNADFGQMQTRTARVDISGHGDVHIAPTEQAKIEISGSGDVYLHSDPKTLDTDMHGSGRVHKVGAGG
jgi:hypothetical protein